MKLPTLQKYTLALAALTAMACVPHAPARAQSQTAPPSAARAILDMQLNSAATQPVPPPITGDEAARIWRAYITRAGNTSGSATAATPLPPRGTP